MPLASRTSALLLWEKNHATYINLWWWLLLYFFIPFTSPCPPLIFLLLHFLLVFFLSPIFSVFPHRHLFLRRFFLLHVLLLILFCFFNCSISFRFSSSPASSSFVPYFLFFVPSSSSVFSPFVPSSLHFVPFFLLFPSSFVTLSCPISFWFPSSPSSSVSFPLCPFFSILGHFFSSLPFVFHYLVIFLLLIWSLRGIFTLMRRNKKKNHFLFFLTLVSGNRIYTLLWGQDFFFLILLQYSKWVAWKQFWKCAFSL